MRSRGRRFLHVVDSEEEGGLMFSETHEEDERMCWIKTTVRLSKRM